MSLNYNEINELLDMPIGTKITLTDDKVFVKYKNVDNVNAKDKDCYDCWTNGKETLAPIEFKYLDIFKVEEPNYSTIYSLILTDKEKEYLHNIIKPFIENVEYIIKRNCYDGHYIQITLSTVEIINLPCFKRDEMYKGMKLERPYTINELGLDY